jgi:hypothetical protein
MPLSPTPTNNKNGVLRFLYLNIYSFLLFVAGILTLAAPFYLITRWTLVAQAIIAIKLFAFAAKLLSAWDDKKLKMDILKKRNKDEFRPDAFTPFMQAPCGRLVARQVLRDLGKPEEYKSLLKLRRPLFERLRENCTPQKTVIYINKDSL